MPRFVSDKSVDGIIVAGKIPDALVKKLSGSNIPMVFVDYAPQNDSYPLILIDNVSGGMKATEHLIELGHSKIGFIAGDIDHPSIKERLNGYKAALEKAGINFRQELVISETPYPDRQNGFLSAQKLFERCKNITALFACNDAMAIGAMQFLRDKGYKIPQDVSVVGFDDVEADLMIDPPLTTIRVPKIELGVESFRAMVQILKQKKTVHKKILIPVELIIRKSTQSIK